MTEWARPFRLHLQDGRVWHGVQFPVGLVVVTHPGESDLPGAFTLGLTLDALLEERHPEDPFHGARAEWAPAAADSNPDLLLELAEQHRPRLEPDPCAVNEGQYLAQCRACDGNQQQIVQPARDPIPECRFWTEAKARSLVTDTPLPGIAGEAP